jgi:hypothetical protein
VSELSENERTSEATDTSGTGRPGVTTAGERSDAPRSLDDGSGSLDPGSQRPPTADQAGSGPLKPAPGSDQISRQGGDGPDDRPIAAGEATSPATDALVRNGDSFRSRWSSVQVGFVDDPGRAVEEAEQLVTDVITDLVEGFQQRRQQLEGAEDATTDQMRVAFQSYRDFFDRLLMV